MHFHHNGKFSQINSIFFKAEKEDSFYMGCGTSDFETFQSAKVLILIFHNSTIIWSLLISGKLEIDCFLRFDFWIDCLSQEIFSIFSSHCDLVWVYLIHHTRESIDCLTEGIGYIMDENNVSEFTYTILCKNLLCLITLIKLKDGEWINEWQHQVLKVLIEKKNKFRDFLKCWTSKSCDWTSGSVLEVTSVHNDIWTYVIHPSRVCFWLVFLPAPGKMELSLVLFVSVAQKEYTYSFYHNKIFCILLPD